MARGRQAIYRPKTAARIQGVLSAHGAKAFEAARVALANMTGLSALSVSDGDTVEWLARVWDETSSKERARIYGVLRAEITQQR